MSTKLYVGNLGYNVNSDQLQQLFADCGQVASAKVITDKFSGRSKGFGFVEMDSDDAAQTAIGKLDGVEVDGRPMRVSEARPQEPRESRGGGGGGGYGSRDRDNNRGGNW